MPKLATKELPSTMPADFPYVDSRTFRKYFAYGKFGEAALRARLPSPIYWIQPDRKVLWNLVLIRDFLLNGDGPAHARLREEFVATLPQSR